MKDNLLSKEVLVPNQYHGQRIDVVLAQLFPDFSRSQLSFWLKEGAITVDGRQYKPKEKIHCGKLIKLNIDLFNQEIEAQAEVIPLEIIFEDDYLLVINKQAGLVVHPGAGNPCHTLVNALLHHSSNLRHLSRAGIVHRLDKDTTGLLLVAKTLTTYTHLVKQMQDREIQRHYQALTCGHIISGGTIDTFYGRHPRNRLKMSVCKQGRQAITHFSIQKQYHYFTLLDVTLMTGRTHQIRVHMAHINHPVVGDPLYGGQSRLPAGASDPVRVAVKQFKRQALHACKLSFIHPHSQEKLTFTAELPDDFSRLLKTLDTNLV